MLRFRRHVRGEVPHDFHRDGRGEMRFRRADGRRLHHLKRFELPHANPGVVEPPGHANENAPYRRSPRPAMSTPTSAAAAKDFKVQAGLVTRDLRHRTLIQTALKKYETARDLRRAAFGDYQAARQAA